LDLAFFGLTTNTVSEYRKNVFTQIHEIVFHGRGGYSWETVYDMPIWLRKFTFHKLNEYYEKENRAMEQARKDPNKQTLVDSSGKVTPPNFKQKTSYK
jgi:hypothetical protein